MPKPRKDITGHKFGYWTVEGFEGNSFWRCRCRCGTVAVVRGPHLKRGHSQSCGCMKSELIRARLIAGLAGQRFGRLAVIESLGVDVRRDQQWRCQCDCGQETIVPTGRLNSGQTQSCGCLRLDRTSTHRMSRSPTYVVWNKMKARCDNPKQSGYENYGGRGISYDPRWSRFEAFLADMGERPIGCSIERADANTGYNKENCSWVPKAHQAKNTRRTKVVTVDGVEMVLADAIAMIRAKATWKYARK